MGNIQVRVRKPDKRFSVLMQSSGSVTVSIRRIVVKNSKLEELLNADPLTFGLQDGFTVIYNTARKLWQTQHVPTVINEAVDLDGGTY